MIYLAFVDGGHGTHTPGKRTPYIKELGRVIHEHEFNQPVSLITLAELKRHGVHVFDVAHGDTDVPLADRVNKANRIYREYANKYGKSNVKAVYVSTHFNAFDGSFGGHDPSGISVHIYPGHRNKEAGRLADCVAGFLKQGTQQVFRGVKEDNFFVLRKTDMPAILTENGFMDNLREALLMLDKGFQAEVGIEQAKGVLKYFGLSYKVESKNVVEKKEDDDVIERAIIINSFADYPIAEMIANKTKAALYTKHSIGNQKVKVCILAGAEKGNIQAEEFIDLSGVDRGVTAANLYKYYKSL